MFGKLVTLTGVELSSDFNVCYGLPDELSKKLKRYELAFANVEFSCGRPDATVTYIYSGHWVREKGDGFKEIMVFNGELERDDKEEYLLVIIPRANYLKTTATKIAGRYPNEAILEMRAGDTLEVSCWYDARQDVHVYVAVEVGNEMFLIKKTR